MVGWDNIKKSGIWVNIEKIQMKVLAMHITKQKSTFDIFMVIY